MTDREAVYMAQELLDRAQHLTHSGVTQGWLNVALTAISAILDQHDSNSYRVTSPVARPPEEYFRQTINHMENLKKTLEYTTKRNGGVLDD